MGALTICLLGAPAIMDKLPLELVTSPRPLVSAVCVCVCVCVLYICVLYMCVRECVCEYCVCVCE